jgi:hypothetical protein
MRQRIAVLEAWVVEGRMDAAKARKEIAVINAQIEVILNGFRVEENGVTYRGKPVESETRGGKEGEES